jgi:hypothetical protein
MKEKPMKTLTVEIFSQWMEAYGAASEHNDPQASAELFTPDAKYHETPFDEPLVGRQAIQDYWEKGARTLEDKETAALPDGRRNSRAANPAGASCWTASSWSSSTREICAASSASGGTSKLSTQPHPTDESSPRSLRRLTRAGSGV